MIVENNSVDEKNLIGVGDLVKSKLTGHYYYISKNRHGEFVYTKLTNNYTSSGFSKIETLLNAMLCGNAYEVYKSDEFKLVIE